MTTRSWPRWPQVLFIAAYSAVVGYAVGGSGRAWVGVVAGVSLFALSIWATVDTAKGGTAERSDRFFGPKGRRLP